MSARDEVTLILQSAGELDGATEKLLPLIYDELRRLAASQMVGETPGQTLQPTALVHEAYLRLVGGDEVSWESRGHFFAAAARSMRQILINRAKQKQSLKHGGQFTKQDLDPELFADEPPPQSLLLLDRALEKLREIDPRKAEIVMLRYFAGLNIEETALSLGLSSATVKRDWQFAKTWLFREMNDYDS